LCKYGFAGGGEGFPDLYVHVLCGEDAMCDFKEKGERGIEEEGVEMVIVFGSNFEFGELTV
jgi:hypothetical protein